MKGNVPPTMTISDLPVSWPRDCSCFIFDDTCSYGSNWNFCAAFVAGSVPVYESGVLNSMPPGQYMHLPWGHSYGFGITAMTATPEAVLAGLTISVFRYLLSLGR